MSLHMTAVGMGRARAAARFTETLEAYTVEKVLDESTGLYEDTDVFLYQNVPGGVKYPTLTVHEREQGSQVPAAQDIEVHVAVGATPNVVVNVLWRVTASAADSAFVGREFRTKGEAQSGQVTAHRYPVERVT